MSAGEWALSQDLTLGELPLRLCLDASLAALRLPLHASRHASAPSTVLELRASSEVHSEPRFFGTTLVASGCKLERSIAHGYETVRGVCFPSVAALKHALRFGTQPALLRKGWLLLHASSVRLADGIHVFVAPSGTGKTTLARRFQSEGAEVLGQEIALVKGGRVEVHPSQELAGASGGPLAAIHLLRQGAAPGLSELPAAAAVRRLLALTMVYESSAESAAMALDAVIKLVKGQRVFETQVTNDARALDPFRSLLPGKAS